MDPVLAFSYDQTMRLGRLGDIIIPSVTDVIRPLSFVKGDVSLGRAIHYAAELLDTDRLDWKTVDDKVMPWLMGWEKFKRETGFKSHRIEERLVHPALMYHGQLDREGTWNLSSRRVVVDLKKYNPGKVGGIQTAGYDLLLPVLKEPRDRVVVELTAEAGYRIHWNKDIDDRSVFLSLLTIHNWRQRNGLSDR